MDLQSPLVADRGAVAGVQHQTIEFHRTPEHLQPRMSARPQVVLNRPGLIEFGQKKTR